MDEELSKESLEEMIKEVRDMIADMEEPTGKPTKVLIQPALLAQRGYTVEDVSKMVRKVPAGYTAEELERDSPYNQWMGEK